MARPWTAALPKLLGQATRLCVVHSRPGASLRTALAPGGEDAALTEAMEQSGFEIVWRTSTGPAPQPSVSAPREALLIDALCAASAPTPSARVEVLSQDLERLRATRPDRDRLLVRVAATKDERAVILALSTAGFTILRIERPSQSRAAWIAARPDPLRIRGYRAGDEGAILDLFEPSFHAQRSPAHWRWKYLDNPWGSRRISMAFGDQGSSLVGHYAGYPVRFLAYPTETERRPEPERWPAIQVGDTMTHPKVRSHGRGPASVLGRLVRHFYAAYCTDRVAFNFGFNTGNIQRFSERFVGAEAVEPVTFRRLDIASPRHPRRAGGGGYSIARDLSPSTAFDRFLARVGPAYGILLERSSLYLRWRYLDCPDPSPFVLLAARRFGRLVAWGVFRRRGESLLWADALIDPRHPGAADALLDAARAWDHAESQVRGDAAAVAIEAWFPPRPPWLDRRLVALGFVTEPEPDDLTLMIVPHRLAETAAALRGRLYYTKGDGDLA